jgi:hypothetical protein
MDQPDIFHPPGGGMQYGDKRFSSIFVAHNVGDNTQQVINGVGFAPTAVFLYANAGGANQCQGQSTAPTGGDMCLYNAGGGNWNTSGFLIQLTNGIFETATIASWDVDGITLNWVSFGAGVDHLWLVFMR